MRTGSATSPGPHANGDATIPQRYSHLLIGSLILIAVLGLTLGSGIFSLADNARTEIRFYHLSEDAATLSETLRDRMEANYPGTFTDTATVGDLTFDLSNEFKHSEYCAVEPVVQRNGQEIDDYTINNQIRRYHDRYEGDQTQTYGDLEVEFANPFYTDPYIYRGTFYGMQGCHGTFNRYYLPVDVDAIDVDTTVPDKVAQGQSVTTQVTITNQWRTLRADTAVELCVDGQTCQTLTKEDVRIRSGTTQSLTFEHTPDRAGDLTADVSGRIGLDLSQYHIEGVSVDCNRDGNRQDPTTCEMIQIGELEDHGVTAVKSPGQAILDNELLLATLELRWERLKRWLFGGPL